MCMSTFILILQLERKINGMSQSSYEEGFSNKEFNDIFNNTLMQYRKTCNGLLLVFETNKQTGKTSSQSENTRRYKWIEVLV